MAAAAAIDLWNDDWEKIADEESKVEADSKDPKTAGEASETSSGSSTASNSSSSITAPAAPKLLVKRVPNEEENKKLWEAANAANPFEILPSTSGPGQKVIGYKPELKILKRAPPTNPTPSARTTVSADSPAILDRKEKERRYAEARERLFGPTSSTSTTSSTPNQSASNTPTAGMSRTSSSTGITTKSTDNAGASSASSRDRAGGGTRGGKKGGRGNCNTGNNPRTGSPANKVGNGMDRKERVGDANRTSGIVGGITKLTDNGWVYTGTGHNSRGPSPSARLPGERGGGSGVSALTSGMMSMGLHGSTAYNASGQPYPGGTSAVKAWGAGTMGGNGIGTAAGGPIDTLSHHSPHGAHGVTSAPVYSQHQVYTSNPSQVSQPVQQYNRYGGPLPVLPFHQQLQTSPYQQSSTNPSYGMPPSPHPPPPPQPPHPPLHHQPPHQHHQPPIQPFMAYQRLGPQQGPPPALPPGYHEPIPPIGGTGQNRMMYLQDPNSFAPRPPPPQGSLMPGFGNRNMQGSGAENDNLPIREPRGPDGGAGRGFVGRGVRSIGRGGF